MKVKGIVAIIAVMVVVGLYFAYTSGYVFWIDESWIIVFNHLDGYDVYSAYYLQGHYGAELITIYEAGVWQSPDSLLNNASQNLLFIGGGEEFAGRVPWAETWPSLTVILPDRWPDIYLTNDGTWDKWWIHTPKDDYIIMENGTLLHDYGFIAKGYDSTLKRWIIICVGYSGFSTGAGATIIGEQLPRLELCSWMVYEVPLDAWTNNQDVTLWNPSLLQASIIATG